MGTIKRGFANNILTTGKFDATDLSGTIPSSNVANTTLSSITSVPASVGDLVQSVAADPSPVSAGDVWYNSTTGALKASVVLPSVWAAGGNLATARNQLGAAGIQTAGLGFGGSTGPANTNATEEYNGTSWGPGGNMGTTRRALAGAGTQTAGLGFGGLTPVSNNVNNTEEYDGSTWTTGGNLNNARRLLAGAGTQTTGLGFGGIISSDSTEEYDGSTWTTGGNLGTGRYLLGGAGTQTSALAFGGSPPITAATEEYDGSSWTAGGALGTARKALGGAGTQTAGLGFGGYVPGTPPANPGNNQNTTEEYNGTSWTAGGNLATTRGYLAGCGTQTVGLAFGGNTTAATAATEEYTGATAVTQTVTTS